MKKLRVPTYMVHHVHEQGQHELRDVLLSIVEIVFFVNEKYI